MIDMTVELKSEPKKPKMAVGDVFSSKSGVYMITESHASVTGTKFFRVVNLKTAQHTDGVTSIFELMSNYPDAKRLEQITAAEFVEE